MAERDSLLLGPTEQRLAYVESITMPSLKQVFAQAARLPKLEVAGFMHGGTIEFFPDEALYAAHVDIRGIMGVEAFRASGEEGKVFFHSHPSGRPFLSGADQLYAHIGLAMVTCGHGHYDGADNARQAVTIAVPTHIKTLEEIYNICTPLPEPNIHDMSLIDGLLRTHFPCTSRNINIG